MENTQNNTQESTNDNIQEDMIYTKEFLLCRAYEALDLNKTKVKVERLEFVNRDRKSYIPNFIKMCDSINRNREEVKAYFTKELHMDTSIKEDGSLRIDNLSKKVIVDTIYTKFITDHVMCKSCKSIKTHIERHDRIDYMICDTCKSKRAIDKSK